jgi:IS5 family transposase
MYRKAQEQETAPEKFQLPFEEKLALDNRWVIMTKIIPWSEFEAEYAAMFFSEIGAPAKTFRMALGALIDPETAIAHDNLAIWGRVTGHGCYGIAC